MTDPAGPVETHETEDFALALLAKIDRLIECIGASTLVSAQVLESNKALLDALLNVDPEPNPEEAPPKKRVTMDGYEY